MAWADACISLFGLIPVYRSWEKFDIGTSMCLDIGTSLCLDIGTLRKNWAKKNLGKKIELKKNIEKKKFGIKFGVLGEKI